MNEIKIHEPKEFHFNIMPNEERERMAAEWEKEDERRKKNEAYERYKKSGVPEKFFNSSFDTFIAETDKEKEVKQKVVEFAKNPKNRVMMLCGLNGGGKTHLLCSALRVVGGEYITSSMLCVKYDSAIGFKATMSREEILRHYTTLRGLLVIDECAKYFVNPDLEKFVLMNVICGRYENNLATGLGTNSDKKALVNFLGKACFDRLTEVGTTVEFNFESKRKSRRAV